MVYTYTDDDDDSQTAMSEVIQLGDVADPISGPTTNILGANEGTPISTGGSIRVDNSGNSVDVQWQMLSSRPESQWTDISGATDIELDVTSAHAGNMLRAKVTYTADDDSTTTDVDEEGWVVWVEYTEVITVSGATGNTDPEVVQGNHLFRVEPEQKSSAPGAVQKATVATFDASNLFFDADGEDLTYTITAVTPDLDSPATATEAGTDADLGTGGSVYRVYTSEWNETDSAAETTDEVQQSFSINKGTGMVTYLTDTEGGHDGNTDDGLGNTLTFTITASDGGDGTDVTATVMVRVNVAPIAISLEDEGTSAAANLPMPGKDVTGRHLQDDTDTNITYRDDAENAAVKLADINVQDENATDDKFGTHKITFSGRGADMFEARRDDDTDGSTWEIWLKDDATFDFEKLVNTAEKNEEEDTIELSITVTATDGGGLRTQGVFKVTLVDADTEEDAETPETVTPTVDDPEVPGLEDDADDSDNDGPVIPPDDGGAFIDGDDLIGLNIDDLLGDYVLAIDEIDVA